MTLVIIIGLVLAAVLSVNSIIKNFNKSERFFEYTKESKNAINTIDYSFNNKK